MRYNFECTAFFNRYDDLTYAYEYMILPDEANQTQLFFSVLIDGEEFNCLIEVDFDNY